MRLAFLATLVIAITACSSSAVPGDIIEPHKMKLIVYDLIRADEWTNLRASTDTAFKKDVEVMKIYKQVFSIHHINHKEFYKSYRYYQAHPDINKALFDSLISHANRKRLVPDTSKTKLPKAL
jgi:hypothetical protein